MTEIRQVVGKAATQVNEQQEVLDALKIPPQLVMGDRENISIADTDILHKMNKTVITQSEPKFNEILNNMDQINFQHERAKITLEGRKTDQQQLLSAIEQLVDKSQATFKELDQRITQMEQYYVKSGFVLKK